MLRIAKIFQGAIDLELFMVRVYREKILEGVEGPVSSVAATAVAASKARQLGVLHLQQAVVGRDEFCVRLEIFEHGRVHVVAVLLFKSY